MLYRHVNDVVKEGMGETCEIKTKVFSIITLHAKMLLTLNVCWGYE